MSTEQELRQTNEQIVRDFLRLLSEKNMNAWIELWAEENKIGNFTPKREYAN